MRPTATGTDEERVSRGFERFVARPGSQTAYVLRHPLETVGLLSAIRRLPVLTARLSGDRQGLAVRDQLGRTLLRRHALAGATAVLTLPEDPAAYLRGSSRSTYTLRKRSRSAAELGVRIEEVDSPDRRRALCALADAAEHADPRPAYRNPLADNADMLDHACWLVALAGERPVLLAVLPVDGGWAALRHFRTLESSREATLSRYLMMAELVAVLRRAGVRHVVVGLGPHRLGNGIRQFQRIVGFRIVRLRVAGRGPASAAARLAAAAVAPVRHRRPVGSAGA